ncbi:MAG: Hsp20/alpha crystallin family protein [Planctomycetes bacterium]|nr:Hsp20/alpha crystallin family protein [Planctomycetota bacterium]
MDISGDRNRRIQVHRRHGIVERRGLYLSHYEIHSMFDEMIHRPWGAVRWNPAVDIREDKEAFIIEMDLPGVKAENVRVLVEGQILAIEGQRQLGPCEEVTTHLCERPDGRFVRTFEFDANIENRKIESRWHEGVLTVTVPKNKKMQ